MPTPREGRSIGAVLEQLKPQFPDLTVSKIRFLENEGLVTPQRTPSGYRTFSERDVERLRYILAAQRDRFWPLKVIREALDGLDRGLTPAEDGSAAARMVPPAAPADPDVPSASELRAVSTLALTQAELASAAGLDEATLAALLTYGLVRPDPDGHYGEPALAVAAAAAALASYGVEPRHLRLFRTAADREVGLVQQMVAPVRAANARRGDADPAAEVLHHCLALHAALVKAALEP
ncbi:MAG: MerR family transcriptional regulator [Dermatophilaceae bacterium]